MNKLCVRLVFCLYSESIDIFGTVFESTTEDDVRRIGGMHYTSTDNIHKVINPLFMDEMRGGKNCLERKQYYRR